MSLLSDLTIAYEVLADDPIEQGIRYGHSVLDALSARIITPRLPEPVLETAAAYSYQAPLSFVDRTVPAVKAPRSPMRRDITSRMRRGSTSHVSRQTIAPGRAYTTRSMIGAL